MRRFPFALALLAAPMVLTPLAASQAQISVTVGLGTAITVAPPALFDYDQPPMPEDGYMWTPGYWAYGGDGYYWVPGTWVQPPSVGVYWTPGYWGWSDGSYRFNNGYWGPEVGYYGGINYGYGYGGVGYQGGEWHGRDFSYNHAVNNFGDVHAGHVYDRPVGEARPGARASFNGPGGASARPTAQEEQAGRQTHFQPTTVQSQHAQAAGQDRELRSSVNSGHPAAAATSRPWDTNRQTAPQQRQAAPQQREPAPQQHQAAPQQREPAPQQRQAPPQQREPAPQQHQAPPQQREPAPQQHQAAPQTQRPAAPQHEEAPKREEEHK